MSFISRASSFISWIPEVLYRAFIEVDESRRIRFVKGFYFQIPRPKVELFVGIGDHGSSLDICVADAREVFASIRSAYDSQDVRSIKVGGLECVTDCRVHQRYPDRVTIKFRGALSARYIISRANVGSALDQYESKFIRVFVG